MLGKYVIKYQSKSSDVPTAGPFSCTCLSLELSCRTRLANPEFSLAVKVLAAELERKIFYFSEACFMSLSFNTYSTCNKD